MSDKMINPYEILAAKLEQLGRQIEAYASQIKEPKTLLTVQEVEEQYDLSKSLQTKKRSSNELPFYRFGNKIYYDRLELENALKGK